MRIDDKDATGSCGFHRTVITGGAGFLGHHLCKAMLIAGSEVVCVDNFSSGTRSNLAELRRHPAFSLHEADVCTAIPIDGPVDLVLHFASPASPSEYAARPIDTLRAGSEGTRNALELAAKNNARFVLASTSEVYGDPLQHPQNETYWGNVNPVGVRAMYDEAKRFAEALTSSYSRTLGLNSAIVRIFNTYGPGLKPGDGRAIPTMIWQALHSEDITIHGDGTQTRSFCYVDDLVEGLLKVACSRTSGPINLGNPEEVSIASLALRIRDVARSSSQIVCVNADGDDPRRRCPDITVAREMLRWSPKTSLQQGLELTVGWFQQQLGSTE